MEQISGLPVLEPSAAVARQVERLLRDNAPEALQGSGGTRLYTSGSLEALERFVRHRGLPGLPAAPLDPAAW